MMNREETLQALAIISKGCDCRRLTRPLTTHEQLPDHICMYSAQISCVNWMAEKSRSYPSPIPYPLYLGFGERLISANHWPMCFVNGSPEDGGLDSNAAGDILLVLRQWVEDQDEDDGGLARYLLKMPDVKNFLNLRDEDQKNGFFTKPYRCSAAHVEEFRTHELPRLNVPCTPATARYLLWLRRGWHETDEPPDQPPKPSRGALLTSLLVRRIIGGSDGLLESGDIPYLIEGSSSWTTATTNESAINTAAKHREFLQKQAPHLFQQYKNFEDKSQRGRRRIDDELAILIDAMLRGDVCLTDDEFDEWAKQFARNEHIRQNKRNELVGLSISPSLSPSKLYAKIRAARKRLDYARKNS